MIYSICDLTGIRLCQIRNCALYRHLLQQEEDDRIGDMLGKEVGEETKYEENDEAD